MQITLFDFMPIFPEIFLLIMICSILLVDLFIRDTQRWVIYTLSQITLLGCALLTLGTSFPEPVHALNGMVVIDAMGNILKLLTYIATAVVFAYSREYITVRGLFKGEFFVLVLFAVLGMLLMISANHFLMLYLGLELLSLSLYALVALNRDSAQSTEAAMKYFILGALASGMLLYGISMLYGGTGTLEISQMAQAIHAGAFNKTIVVFGVVFVVAGIAFKLGAVPFHMWVPDVYHGAPTAMTLLIGSAPKFAAFAMVMRVLVFGLLDVAGDWQSMLMLLAVASMVLGNLTAIAQTNIKRMFAYSAISHMGFMLVGMLSGVVDGNKLLALNAYSSSMFYVVAYVLMSLGGFGMILLLSRAGFEAETLDDFRGLNKRSPWYAFIMLVLMFSMAGLPPTIGFYAKFAVLQAAVAAGYVWLAVIAVLASLIGAFYYLRIVKLMYFDAPTDTAPIYAQTDVKVVLSANGLAVLAFGIFPQPLMALCAYAMIRALT